MARGNVICSLDSLTVPDWPDPPEYTVHIAMCPLTRVKAEADSRDDILFGKGMWYRATDMLDASCPCRQQHLIG